MLNLRHFFSLGLLLLGALRVYAQVTLTNKGEKVFVLPGNSITIKGNYINDTPGTSANDNPQFVNYGSIFITGDVTNNSPDPLMEPDGTGLLELNGNSVQQLAGSTTINLYTLNLNKTGAVQLIRDIEVANQINFLSGLMDLNGKMLDLGNTGILFNENNTSRIYSSMGGTVNFTLPSSPVINDVPGGLGLSLQGTVLTNTVIKRGHQPQTTAGDGSINRYFDVAVPAGQTIHQLRLHYFDAEIPGGFTEADLAIYISYDNGSVWQKIGGTVNAASNQVQVSSLNLSSNFRLTLSKKDCAAPPIVDLGPPSRDFCLGNSVTLDAGNPGAFYSWSTTASTQTITTSVAGMFSVVVRNARGCEGTDNITLVERPIPAANFTSGIACPAQGVPFTNTSTISAGTLTYTWNFGDPAVTTDVSALQNPAYAYPLAGDYNVTLTATSAFGCAHMINKTVTVYPLPQPDFTFAKACLGQSTEFTNTSTITLGGMTYSWDFNDATTSAAINPVKSFSGIGSYNVQLTATSNAGCVKSIVKPVTINHTPIVNFTASNGCEDVAVSINNTSSIASGSLTYAWDFGDATVSTAVTPVKSYASPGNYSIVLTATSNFNCSATSIKPIIVYTTPVAAFAFVNDCEDRNFTFTNNSTSAQGALTYLWDFDDSGGTATAPNPSRVFSNAGVYDVSLQATSSFGCRNTIIHPLTVYPAPVVDFTFSNACPGINIPFNNSTTISSGTFTYRWDFDNSATSVLINPSESFDSPGMYDIVLTATSDQGCVQHRSKQLTVYAEPVLDFGGSIQTCGTSYVLDALNPGSSYLWSTGATTRTITVTAGGNYSVTVTNANGCSVSETVSITLNDAVTPDLGINRSVCGNAILDAGYPGSTYLWSTGATSRTINITSTGTYSVTVTDPNGCSGSDNVFITVNPAPAVNLGPDRSSCTNTPLVLNATNPNSTYVWSDNSTASTLQVTTSGTYFVEVRNTAGCMDRDTVNIIINDAPDNTVPATLNACDRTVLDAGNAGSTYVWSTGSSQQTIPVTASGTYRVDVTTSAGCTAQFTSNVTIRPGPTANLGADRIVCFNETVSLDAGNTGSTYAWSTGAISKTISLKTAGLYWVDVTAANGCITRDTIIVNMHPEIINALPDSYNLCSDESRVFDATSPQAVAYEWQNAEGVISTNPQVTLANDGRYWVVLRDINNCTATDTVNIVTDTDPITARFLVATYVNTGDSVRFVQLSYPDPVLFNWDFKDGITSAASDPVHIYLRGGDFDASLGVTDPRGCSDAMSKIITVTFTGGGRREEVKVPFTEILHSNLYPNPASQELTLQLELNQETEIVISIYSVNGKFIQSKNVTLQDTNIEFDVGSLAKGVYIMKVSVQGSNRVMRFVKM